MQNNHFQVLDATFQCHGRRASMTPEVAGHCGGLQVPKCGSFQSSVEQAVLPALAIVTAAEDNGQSPTEALADALPLLANASALTMPCREMCEAVVRTCACAQELTFGELVGAWARGGGAGGLSGGVPVPRHFLSAVFARLAAKPLCSLFAPGDTPGFVGHCDAAMASTCSNGDRWACMRLASRALYVSGPHRRLCVQRVPVPGSHDQDSLQQQGSQQASLEHNMWHFWSPMSAGRAVLGGAGFWCMLPGSVTSSAARCCRRSQRTRQV